MNTEEIIKQVEKFSPEKTKIYFYLLGNPQRPKDIHFNAPLLRDSEGWDITKKWQEKKSEYDRLSNVLKNYTTYQKRKTSGEEYELRQNLIILRSGLNKLRVKITYSHTTYRTIINDLLKSKFLIKTRKEKGKIEANPEVIYTIIEEHGLTKKSVEEAKKRFDKLIKNEEWKKYILNANKSSFMTLLLHLVFVDDCIMIADFPYSLRFEGVVEFNKFTTALYPPIFNKCYEIEKLEWITTEARSKVKKSYLIREISQYMYIKMLTLLKSEWKSRKGEMLRKRLLREIFDYIRGCKYHVVKEVMGESWEKEVRNGVELYKHPRRLDTRIR